jgi:hypothetical protein
MQYLYNFLIVFLALIVSHFIRPFFGAYANKKGENLATKEDIAQLTKIAEGIRAEISDKVWDRQEQRKLKRDAVFEVVRALGELRNALLNLAYAYSLSAPEYADLRTKVQGIKKEASERWESCDAKLDGANFLADLFVGKELGTALYEYTHEMRSVALKVLDGDTVIFTSSTAARSQKATAVYLSARKELNLENAE